MALIKCGECGKEISSKAQSCPNCGAKVKQGIGCLQSIIFIIIGSALVAYLLIVTDDPNSSSNSTSSHNVVSSKPAPPNAALREESCVALGFKYGLCSTKTMLGIKCEPENDIIIPERCRGKQSTQEAIAAGVKTVYDIMGIEN